MFFIKRDSIQRKIFILVFLIILILTACKEIPPEKRLEGTWRNGVIYIVFDEDGTYATADLPGDLHENPSSKGTYSFDGEQLSLFEDDPGICYGMMAKYAVSFPEENQATYLMVQDPCTERERLLACCLWRRHEP
ncbi:MAG: hypothetical protein PVF83_16620 [Anaerolineales bacterium]|jgi:hypothetical protein